MTTTTTQTSPKAVFDNAITSVLGGKHTFAICVVEEYTLGEGDRHPTADVRPVQKRRTNKKSEVEFVDAPTHLDVPVPPIAFGDWFLHGALKVGDYVLVAYAERSQDEWIANGGTDIEPEDPRRFDDQDAVVLWRINPRNDGDAPVLSGTDLTLAKRDGSVSIVIKENGEIVLTGATIKLGSDAATIPVALSSVVDSFIGTLDNVFRTLWSPVPTDGGAALKATYLANFVTPPGSSAASKAVAE